MMAPTLSAWLMVGVLALISVPSANAQFFRDDFDGNSIDGSKWAVDLGSGTVTVAGGLVTLSNSGSVFPVVTTLADPFPVGDFVVRLRLAYVSQQHCGDGFGAMDNFWENYHGASVCRPFLLWEDNGGRYGYTASVGTNWYSTSTDPEFHLYEWIYTGGEYQLFVDGEFKSLGACAPRATRIFFGHPHPISCSAAWTSFAIDYIEVEPFGATSSGTRTWGALKLLYR